MTKLQRRKIFEEAIRMIESGDQSFSCPALDMASEEYQSKARAEYCRLFQEHPSSYWLDRQAPGLNDEQKKFLRIMLLTVASEVL